MRVLVVLLLLWGAQVRAEDDPNADTLLVGRIYPVAGAAEFVSGLIFDASGKVLAHGDANELRAKQADSGSTLREIIVDGTVIPGLIDAHGHVLGLGLSLLQANLVDTRNVDEVIARVREKSGSAPRGAWLIGRGWDQNDWPDRQFPTRAVLDRAFADQPVWLTRIDGHAGWANSKALAKAKITSATPDPQGGKILKDANGEPTGVLVDAAMDLMQSAIPDLTKDVRRRAVRLALQHASAAGLTCVHDAGVSRADLALYRELADNQELPIRITAMADGDQQALADLCAKGAYAHASGRLQMRTVKLYADGALGSRGAALTADYADDVGNRGLLIEPEDKLKAQIARVAGCGMQPAVHAIGDRANHLVLDAYAALEMKQRTRLRPRIEHAQIVGLDDIPRFAELGVIASMQPTHATSDMPWALDRVGTERLRGAYAWRRFLDSGARLAFGSDFPVEGVEPLIGIYAAVTRQDAKGEPEGGWTPDQRVSMNEALDGFTRGAAYAGFAEDRVGTLEVGKRADFVVLSIDPHQVRGRALTAIKVRSTWVDGKAVWTAR